MPDEARREEARARERLETRLAEATARAEQAEARAKEAEKSAKEASKRAKEAERGARRAVIPTPPARTFPTRPRPAAMHEPEESRRELPFGLSSEMILGVALVIAGLLIAILILTGALGVG